MACNSQGTAEHQENTQTKDHGHDTAMLQFNNGSKWKADAPTKKNVAAIVQVINDSAYSTASTRQELATQLQSRIDTLVKQCRMTGPDHDALHAWLEELIKDVKELKEEDEDFIDAYTAVKKDLDRFYELFE
jgi:hypothetical protein